MDRKRSTLDKAIEGGATFDWITPLASLLSRDVTLCVMWHDQAPATSTLESAGIDYKRLRLGGDYVNLDVARSDASRAIRTLGAAGVTAWRV